MYSKWKSARNSKVMLAGLLFLGVGIVPCVEAGAGCTTDGFGGPTGTDAGRGNSIALDSAGHVVWVRLTGGINQEDTKVILRHCTGTTWEDIEIAGGPLLCCDGEVCVECDDCEECDEEEECVHGIGGILGIELGGAVSVAVDSFNGAGGNDRVCVAFTKGHSSSYDNSFSFHYAMVDLDETIGMEAGMPVAISNGTTANAHNWFSTGNCDYDTWGTLGSYPYDIYGAGWSGGVERTGGSIVVENAGGEFWFACSVGSYLDHFSSNPTNWNYEEHSAIYVVKEDSTSIVTHAAFCETSNNQASNTDGTPFSFAADPYDATREGVCYLSYADGDHYSVVSNAAPTGFVNPEFGLTGAPGCTIPYTCTDVTTLPLLAVRNDQLYATFTRHWYEITQPSPLIYKERFSTKYSSIDLSLGGSAAWSAETYVYTPSYPGDGTFPWNIGLNPDGDVVKIHYSYENTDTEDFQWRTTFYTTGGSSSGGTYIARPDFLGSRLLVNDSDALVSWLVTYADWDYDRRDNIEINGWIHYLYAN